MAEPVLNSPRVVAGIREGIAASVPEHMDVNFEREAGTLPDAFDHPVDGIGGEWRAPLRLEHVAAAGLALQLAQRAQFVTPDRVRCRLAVLGAPHVQGGRAIEFDL